MEHVQTTGNQWFCVVCQAKVDAFRKVDLWKLPPVLVLHLQRFTFDHRTLQFQKFDRLLSAPMRLDLAGLCASPQRDRSSYDIVCVANHSGSLGCGHHTATCRLGGSSGTPAPGAAEWFCFDDEAVWPLAAGEPAVGREAYVLFLERCGLGEQPGGGTCRRQSLAKPEHWPHRQSVVGPLVWAFGPSGDDAKETAGTGTGGHKIAAVVASGPAAAGGVPADFAKLALMEGWLCRCSSGLVGEWVWQWCVLCPGALRFFTDAECQVDAGEIVLSRLVCLDVFAEPCAASGDSELFVFSVSDAPSGGAPAELCYLATDSEESMSAWTKAIQRVTAGDVPVPRGACCALS